MSYPCARVQLRVQYASMDISSYLLGKVRRALRDAGAPQTLLIGVSGGADSVALLRLLCALRAEEGLSLYAVHVQHDLRANAGLDAEFVVSLCAALGVPCAVRPVHVERRGSVEDAARKARYVAFSDEYSKKDAQALVLAHHLNDQAETVLLHLAYGAGAGALGGMRALSARGGMTILRPLLSVRRSELTAYLSELKQGWREDGTNADTRFTRNFLRHDILPALEARMPGAAVSFARAADILACEDDLLARETERLLLQCACPAPPCPFVLLSALAQAHPALRRRAVRAFLAPAGTLSYEKTLETLDALHAPGALINLPGGWHALVTGERLHLLSPTAPPVPAPVSPFSSPWFNAENANGAVGDGKRAQAFPRAALDRAVVRTRLPGDKIVPFGQNGTQPLKKYLIDRKIDRPFRDFAPLLCIGNEVLWAPGIGVSEKARVPKGEQAVLLSLLARLPWELPKQSPENG